MALTTDFGHADPFVGILKAVILGLCPEARLLDLTHGLPPQDLVAGYLALEAALPYVPDGAVHLAVVDPGVGTDRPALAARTARHWFVAPDNGLLSFLGDDDLLELRHIENPAVMLHPVSRTFHGRDVFAPAAARLATGAPGCLLGPEAHDRVRLHLPGNRAEGLGVRGQVLAFDHFGNAVTSLRAADLPPGARRCRTGGREFALARTYGDAEPGQPLAVVGSSGRVEVCLRAGNAREVLGLGRADAVWVGP